MFEDVLIKLLNLMTVIAFIAIVFVQSSHFCFFLSCSPKNIFCRDNVSYAALQCFVCPACLIVIIVKST